MRRKDREVKSQEEILKIMEACRVVRIGLAGEDGYPYIVPMNFGYEAEDGQIYLYLHGAAAGRKYELMRKNGVCSFEMDCGHQLELLYETANVTMRYRCVMGKAEITFLEGEEKRRGIDALMRRDEATRDFAYNEAALSHTAVMRLKVTEYSGKCNPGSTAV